MGEPSEHKTVHIPTLKIVILQEMLQQATCPEDHTEVPFTPGIVVWIYTIQHLKTTESMMLQATVLVEEHYP